MQDAYVVEANAIGTWNQIGYTAPGQSSQGGAESTVLFYKENATGYQWQAIPKVNMNDCTTSETNGWKLGAKASVVNDRGEVLYKTDGSTKCTGLTPSFIALTSGRSTASVD